MTLKYLISSSICRGVKVGDDLYIEGDLQTLEEIDEINEKPSCLVQLELFKVSGTDAE